MNERQVLAAVQTHGSLSRAEITRLTGISGPTVTRAVGALLDANLLEEGDFRQAALGRPGKVLRLSASSVSVLGAVVGPERCEVVASGLDGQIHQRHIHQFPDATAKYDDLVRQFAEQLKTVAAELKTEVLGLGISIPGLLQGAEKRTLLSPNLHQTDGHQIGKDLQERLDLDTIIVQESDALCLAEKMYGAARDVDDFAMLDISDGLGMGVVHKGQLLEGHSGLAGELGHITVQARRPTLRLRQSRLPGNGRHRRRSGPCSIGPSRSPAYHRRHRARGSFRRRCRWVRNSTRWSQYLAVGVAAVLNIFNPRRLFIHGRLLDAGPALFERLLELAKERSLAPSFADCEIIRARGNKRLGAIAAVLHRITTGWDGSSFLG